MDKHFVSMTPCFDESKLRVGEPIIYKALKYLNESDYPGQGVDTVCLVENIHKDKLNLVYIRKYTAKCFTLRIEQVVNGDVLLKPYEKLKTPLTL